MARLRGRLAAVPRGGYTPWVTRESLFPQRFGHYTLLSHVALGGMAEILLALEMSGKARRFVTIKRIRPEHCTDPDYIDFFTAEGRISVRCNHDNLTRSYELGCAEGQHYLAMEFIRGHTLLDLIRAGRRASIILLSRL